MAETYVFLPRFGKASRCVCTKWHRPVPLVFVWHHVQPQVCGGLTNIDNLEQVCPTCHTVIHRCLWMLRQGLLLPRGYRAQISIARRGYAACVLAGTAEQIPNEG